MTEVKYEDLPDGQTKISIKGDNFAQMIQQLAVVLNLQENIKEED